MNQHDNQSDVFDDDIERAIDTRLRVHARAWQDTVPSGPPDRGWERPRAVRRWLGPAGVAAATILAIAGVTLFENRTSTSELSSDIVPWRNLPATNPKLPTIRSQIGPTRAQIASTRACKSSDLRVAKTALGDGASGIQYFVIGIRATRSPCRLDSGYARIWPTLNGAVLQEAPEEHATDLPMHAVWISKSRPAEVTLVAPDSQCPAVRFDGLLVRLPHVNIEARVSATFHSSCDPSYPADHFRTWPLRTANPPHVQVDSPFDRIRVSGPKEISAQAPSIAHFVVTMTSPVDLSLAVCPDYVVLTNAGKHSAGLNCADVKFRDAKGRPYLPAGVPVHFAMEAKIAAPPPCGARGCPGSRFFFSWTLRTPSDQVTTGGAVTIANK